MISYTRSVTTGTARVRGPRALRRGLRRLTLAARRLGVAQSHQRRKGDARQYWADHANGDWAANSHWREAMDPELWTEVGRQHLAIYEQFARALDRPLRPGVMIDWGCGGGANAVAFAPLADRYIAADVSAESVAECIKQVESVCDTPTTAVTVNIDSPETAIADIELDCGLFLCLYVLELTADAEEALRIVRIAEKLLHSGGIAMIQIKYHTADFRTRGRRRNYRRNLANMTTFGIDEFWQHATDCGLTPRLVTLVPENRLDVRYAYFALTKP